MSGVGERKRMVRLLCPSLSKVIPFVAWEEQRIDLGSIAKAFGLDPSTLKLNGHFLSRGPDLVASSVTWRSLLGFFSSRGLPTGGSDSDALLVHGKLCKAGTKRRRKLDGTIDEINNAYGSIGNLRLQLADFNFIKNKKLKANSSVFCGLRIVYKAGSMTRKYSFPLPEPMRELKVTIADASYYYNKVTNYHFPGYTARNNNFKISDGFSLKRKRQQEEFSALKRLIIE